MASLDDSGHARCAALEVIRRRFEHERAGLIVGLPPEYLEAPGFSVLADLASLYRPGLDTQDIGDLLLPYPSSRTIPAHCGFAWPKLHYSDERVVS
jgi:hypothetical protein